jgi:prepilin-type N-terminal cleavage/methylation domain-containing protein
MKNTKGFTLIELLVVIAIIGILSSVVLASLGGARDKGKKAAVQAQLGSIQLQAQLYYDSQTGQGSYGQPTGNCGQGMFDDPEIQRLLTDGALANYDLNTDVVCESAGSPNATSWAVHVVDLGVFGWCVDSTGQAVEGEVIGGSCSAY